MNAAKDVIIAPFSPLDAEG